MLEQLTIKNYKSINELSLDLGRVNIFIGENGCGKSNILEAIALAGAADADKLDREFLLPRGVRATDPEDMISLFGEQNRKEIEISIVIDGKVINYELQSNNKSYPNLIKTVENKSLGNDIKQKLEEIDIELQKITSKIKDRDRDRKALDERIDKIKKDLKNLSIKRVDSYEHSSKKISNFLIYSPENSALRNFYKEGQIEPLGINGEGLLKLIKVISKEEPESLKEIKSCLNLFDWYEDFSIPSEFDEKRSALNIFDKYIKGKNIDQRSANEGFLFILFYIALIVSKDTPPIFSIDNIDASLNPKLCTKLTKEICTLSEKYGKQLFLTTHNPAILDGLDLNDPEQKLFVVSRNRNGHTRVKEITVKDKPISSTGEPLRLSEAMLRGYIGGLPKGF